MIFILIFYLKFCNFKNYKNYSLHKFIKNIKHFNLNKINNKLKIFTKNIVIFDNINDKKFIKKVFKKTKKYLKSEIPFLNLKLKKIKNKKIFLTNQINTISSDLENEELNFNESIILLERFSGIVRSFIMKNKFKSKSKNKSILYFLFTPNNQDFFNSFECSGISQINSKRPKGIIFIDKNNFLHSVISFAHEICHLLGSSHDKQDNYLMSEIHSKNENFLLVSKKTKEEINFYFSTPQ